ncbi:MAG: hypothetical protein ACRC1K_04480, partial [Planctomycetia bacterium]
MPTLIAPSRFHYFVEKLEDRSVPAGLLELVKDVNFAGRPETVNSIVEVNGNVFVAGNDAANGSELWRYFPASNRYEFVADINPGASSSDPSSLTNVAGTLFFSANDGQIGSELYRYFPDVEADDVPFTAVDSSGVQAGSILLDLTAALVDTDDSETLTVTISGVPNGSSFTRGGFAVGTQTRPGVWTFDGPELSNLTFHPPAQLVGELFFTVVATNVDDFFTRNPRPGRSNVPRSQSAVMTVNVFDRLALAPIVVAPAATGIGGTPIPLAITARPADPDGSESITQIVITGLPTGATLSAFTTNDDGIWTLTPAQLAGLTITVPAATANQSSTLFVVATSRESDGGALTSNAPASLSLTVNDGLASTPTVAAASARGFQGQPIPLVVTAALGDLDGSETLSLRIGGVPSDGLLSAGRNNGDGNWELTAEQLVGLTFTPNVLFIGTLNFTATAFSKESFNGAEAQRDADPSPSIVVEASALSRPTLVTANAAGRFDEAIALSVSATVGTGQDMVVVISGVPPAASLSAGRRLGDGSPVYLLTIPDLVGLFYIPAVGSTDPVTLEMIARNIVTGAESEQKPLVVTLQAPTV